MSMIKTASMIVLAFILVGCESTYISKEEAFPKMYNEQPASILVVPAINNTTAPESADYLTTTLAEPLSYQGYYVAPLELVQSIFQQEGILDGAQLENVDPSVFGEQFGVDSVLFVSINKWQTNYYVVSGNVEVALKYELYSTKTGEKLWFYEDSLIVDTSSNDNSSGGVAGLLVNVIATAVSTATTDYVPIAKRVNYMALSSAPLGQYHKLHNTDQTQTSVNRFKAK